MHALIVDDSKVVRTASSRFLDDIGITYDMAEDGLVALGKIKTKKYDFILLDWNMPNMDGIQFLNEAKKLKDFENTKVIFCTTEGEVEKITKAIDSGASEYIMKPFNKEIIEDKLRYLGLIQ
jgi:two-component system chemotaxis response regulator CheY